MTIHDTPAVLPDRRILTNVGDAPPSEALYKENELVVGPDRIDDPLKASEGGCSGIAGQTHHCSHLLGSFQVLKSAPVRFLNSAAARQ